MEAEEAEAEAAAAAGEDELLHTNTRGDCELCELRSLLILCEQLWFSRTVRIR